MLVVGARATRVSGAVAGSGAMRGTTSLAERAGIILELVSATGLVGRGEASPLPGYHTESIDDAERVLAGIAAPFEIGSDEPVEAVRTEARRLVSEGAPASVRFALESALLDLAGQSRGEDVASLLTGGTPAEVRTACTFAGSLGAADAPRLARAAVARGARALKWKATGELGNDLAALGRIRSEIGRGPSLRLDLNGALAPGDAKRALDAYALHGVAHVEEPCRGRALLAMGDASTPWLADESLHDPELARALLDHPSCAGFVIKPALLGLLGAFDLARRALAAGKEVVVTHAFDGPIALAAACELALALPGDLLPCGLETHAALAAYPRLTVAQVEPREGAELEVRRSGRLGLGFAVSESS